MHLIISVVFGVVFGLIVRKPTSAPVLGLIYGFVLWFLFPFVMMPMMMGMPVMHLSQPSMMSLIGHLVYGLILGISYRMMGKACFLPKNNSERQNHSAQQ